MALQYTGIETILTTHLFEKFKKVIDKKLVMPVVGDKLLFLILIYSMKEKPGHVTAKCSVERWLAARLLETPHRPKFFSTGRVRNE
jgi:hypothetical protein